MAFLPKKYRQYLGLGVEIAATIAVPLAIGYLADSYFGFFPWLTLTGILVGLILFITSIIRMSSRLSQSDNDI